MASQNGLRTVMRYALDKNVPKELQDQITYRKLINLPCMILFINRYNTRSYEFIPLRKGIIRWINRESGYLFVTVELMDFVSIKNVDVNGFTNQFIEKLNGKNIPQLQDNDPKNTNDGYYVVESDVNIEENIISDSDSWVKAAEYMSKTKALDEKFAFVKIGILKANENRILMPDKDGAISISPNCKYILEATYYDPTLGEGKFSFNLGFQSPLDGMQTKIYCTSKVNNVRIPISSGKNISLSHKSSSIEISQVENNVGRNVLIIPCKIEPISKDLYAIAIIMIIFSLSIATEYEYSNILFSIMLALKWLVSLIFIAYAGMKLL